MPLGILWMPQSEGYAHLRQRWMRSLENQLLKARFLLIWEHANALEPLSEIHWNSLSMDTLGTINGSAVSPNLLDIWQADKSGFIFRCVWEISNGNKSLKSYWDRFWNEFIEQNLWPNELKALSLCSLELFVSSVKFFYVLCSCGSPSHEHVDNRLVYPDKWFSCMYLESITFAVSVIFHDRFSLIRCQYQNMIPQVSHFFVGNHFLGQFSLLVVSYRFKISRLSVSHIYPHL